MKKENKLLKHPEWATKFRKPGTELRLINNHYYLYEYKTIYNPITKKPKKISGKILGKITEESGFIQSDKRKLTENSQNNLILKIGQTREFGVSNFILNHLSDYSSKLKSFFPDEWKLILLIVYCKFTYNCSIKNMPFYIANSWLFEHLEIDNVNEKKILDVLINLGHNDDIVAKYMLNFITNGNFILVDTSHILNKSGQNDLVHKELNNQNEYEPQINLMYIYDIDNQTPLYYKLQTKEIKETKDYKNFLNECGILNAVVIGDKGSYSNQFENMLLEGKIDYILPIHRKNKLIDYSPIINNTIKATKYYFKYQESNVWYTKVQLSKDRFYILYLDDSLKIDEEKDYLNKIKIYPEEYDFKNFSEKTHNFGTHTIITSIKNKDEKEIYKSYKERLNIEKMFDKYKNYLNEDSLFIQNEETLQGWTFINHVAMQFYHYLSNIIKKNNLTKTYSVNDIIQCLKDVRKIKINEKWCDAENSSQTEKIIKKFKF